MLTDSVAAVTTGAAFLLQSAQGGAGGSAIDGAVGQAGNAFSSLSSSGNFSFLLISTSATGGGGGERSSQGIPSGTGQAGRGGMATAASMGNNDGGNIQVEASAFGGTGGFYGANSGAGGDAIANAIGSGTEVAVVFAQANSSDFGNTIAHAQGTGSDGIVDARAFSGGGAINLIAGIARARVASTANVESRAFVSGSTPTLAMANGLQSAAFVTGAPSGKIPVTAAMVQGASYPGNGSGISETFKSEVDLTIDLAQIVELENLHVHLIDSATSGAGFDMLTFQIYREGSLIEDDIFTDLSAAIKFFADQTLDFGAVKAGDDGLFDLRFVFNLTASAPGDGFSVAYTANVPEPTTWMLLLLGTSVLALFRLKRARG